MEHGGYIQIFMAKFVFIFFYVNKNFDILYF
jgi:hypothetical protein